MKPGYKIEYTLDPNSVYFVVCCFSGSNKIGIFGYKSYEGVQIKSQYYVGVWKPKTKI